MKNFCDFYSRLTKNEKVVIRDVADIRLGWCRSTFYYKIRNFNFTVPEVRELEIIMDNFIPNFNSYVTMVRCYQESGKELSRQKCLRKDQKRNNNLINKMYEQISKSN